MFSSNAAFLARDRSVATGNAVFGSMGAFPGLRKKEVVATSGIVGTASRSMCWKEEIAATSCLQSGQYK